MKLIGEVVSAQALQEIGTLLSEPVRRDQGAAAGEAFNYDVVCPELGLGPGLSAGSLECHVRPPVLARLERHLRTPEMLFASDGDAVVCVAPPQEPRDGRLHGLRALRVAQGQALILRRGAWHWIPYPVGERSTRFLVVFRAQTGDDDLEFCDLADPLDVELTQ